MTLVQLKKNCYNEIKKRCKDANVENKSKFCFIVKQVLNESFDEYFKKQSKG